MKTATTRTGFLRVPLQAYTVRATVFEFSVPILINTSNPNPAPSYSIAKLWPFLVHLRPELPHCTLGGVDEEGSNNGAHGFTLAHMSGPCW